MRGIVAHEYFGVSDEIVWNVVTDIGLIPFAIPQDRLDLGKLLPLRFNHHPVSVLPEQSSQLPQL
jgi:hypothetical protein